MIPVTEEGAGRSQWVSFYSNSISFLFSLNVFFESQVPKPVSYYAVQTRTDGEKLCWKGLWRATGKRNMTIQCVTHQRAAATRPSAGRAVCGARVGLRRHRQTAGRGRTDGTCHFTCVSLKIWIKSTAAAQPTKEINSKASLENGELYPPSFLNVNQ